MRVINFRMPFSSILLEIVGVGSRFGILTSYLRKKRLGVIAKYIKGTILDIGCGPGEIVQHLNNKESTKYVGVDIKKRLVENLQNRYPWLTFLCVDVDNEDLPLPMSETKFDTILLLAVIEHLANPKRILKQVSGLLRDEGKLIITTCTPFGGRIHKLISILGLTGKKAMKAHRGFYSRRDLATLLTPFGLYINVYQKFELGLNQLIVCKKRAQT